MMLTKSTTQDRAHLRILAVLVLLLLMLLLPAPNVDVHAAPTRTDVGGPIVSDTTWTAANSPYIAVESVDVWEGVTLTIEPGVTVKFDSEKKLQVNGELIAQGTDGNLITFTSNQASPASGDWGHIQFTSTAITTTMDAEGNYVSGSILQYCVVEYGGYDVPWNSGAIDAHSLLIDHCTVRNNDTLGIYDPGTETAPSRITNNTVSGNSTNFGGGIYAEYSTVSGNTVSGNSANSSGGGIYVKNSTVTGNTVSGNSADSSNGGGIYAENSTVAGNTVSGNSANSSGGGIYVKNSTVTGNTVSGNSADSSNGGGICAENSTVAGNTVSGNAASSSGGGVYAHHNSTIAENTVISNSASLGGGIYSYASSDAYTTDSISVTMTSNVVSGNSATAHGGGMYAHAYGRYDASVTVSGNTVNDNLAGGSGGGIYAYAYTNAYSCYATVPISNNIVSGNSAENSGGGVYAKSYSSFGDSTITMDGNAVNGNQVSATTSGSGVYFSSPGDFQNNTIVHNSGPSSSTVGGLDIDGTPQVHYNNFYGNEPYDVTVVSSGDISGTNNYWGTVTIVDILQQVYDWYDDSSRGKFLYIPYLQDPDPNAPVPAPQNLQANFTNGSAALSWEPIPSTATGYGYKVYYDSDAPGPPYDGTGAAQGDSPIDVGNVVTNYTLSGLSSGTYYVAVTAYDTQGRERWYSNEVNNTVQYSIYLPLVLRSH